MASNGSTISLGNNSTQCPLCSNNVQGRALFNHFLSKHENHILANNTKESVQECIDLKHPFLAHNEDGIVSQGCLGCKKGFSSFDKASNHFQQDHQCQTKHIAALQHLKTLVKKGGKYTNQEVKQFIQQNGTHYKRIDASDHNRCAYLFLTAQMKGLDIYLARSIKQIGIINDEIETAVKILELINKKAQVTDVQQIYTTDWTKWTTRAWNWITNIQEFYFHTTYHFDFMKYTPFPSPIGDCFPEIELYLNGDVESYKYEPIDLQCVKEFEELKNPSNAKELFMKAYEEDMRKMKEAQEQLKKEKEEMKRRYEAFDERALMAEGAEDED